MSRFPQEFWNVATRALVRLATDVGQWGPAHSWRSTSTEGCWMRVKVISLCWPVKFFHTTLRKIISSWTSLWARRHFEVQGPNCYHKVRRTQKFVWCSIKTSFFFMHTMRDSKHIDKYMLATYISANHWYTEIVGSMFQFYVECFKLILCFLAWSTWFCHHKHGWKNLVKNIQWFHDNKSWAVYPSCHPTTIPAICWHWTQLIFS